MLCLCKNKTKNLDIKFVEHFALLKNQVMDSSAMGNCENLSD